MANPPASLVWMWFKPEPSARTNFRVCVPVYANYGTDQITLLMFIWGSASVSISGGSRETDKVTSDLTGLLQASPPG